LMQGCIVILAILFLSCIVIALRHYSTNSIHYSDVATVSVAAGSVGALTAFGCTLKPAESSLP
jgi:hypothetical protein